MALVWSSTKSSNSVLLLLSCPCCITASCKLFACFIIFITSEKMSLGGSSSVTNSTDMARQQPCGHVRATAPHVACVLFVFPRSHLLGNDQLRTRALLGECTLQAHAATKAIFTFSHHISSFVPVLVAYCILTNAAYMQLIFCTFRAKESSTAICEAVANAVCSNDIVTLLTLHATMLICNCPLPYRYL